VNTVFIYQGAAGDRNPRGILGSNRIGAALAKRLDVAPVAVGFAVPPLHGNWAEELSAARPDLTLLADQVSG